MKTVLSALALTLTLAAPVLASEVEPRRRVSEWHAYGTSLTAGVCGRDCGSGFGYVDVIGSTLGAMIQRHAYSGSDSQTQVGPQIYPRAIEPRSVHFGDLGGSDFLWFGGVKGRPLPGGAADLEDFERTQVAGLAWLALTEPHKVRVTSATRVSRTGSWTGKPTTWWDELISTAAGSTLGTGFSGSVVYVGYSNRHYARDGGKFKITIDGKDYGPYDTQSARQDRNEKHHPPEYFAQAIRIAGLADKPHTLAITVLSGKVQMSWIGSPGAVAGQWRREEPDDRPLVFVSNVIKLSSSFYKVALPFGDPGTGTLYYEKQRKIMESLAKDGLALRSVDARSAYDPETGQSDDLLHPSPTGYRSIAGAFLAEMGRAGIAAPPGRKPTAR